MGKTIMFQWVGFAPKEAQVDHRLQVSCAAVFPSKAAFMRATGHKQSEMGFISDHEFKPGHDFGNDGANLAAANPGTVYYHDTLRNAPRDAAWLAHPTPERS